MFFCPNCNFLLDLAKSSDNSKVKQIVIKKIIDFINPILNNEDTSNFNLLFTEKDLTKSKEYKKLDSNKKKQILDEYQNTIKNKYSKQSNVQLTCNKCGYKQPLKPGTILFKGSNENNQNEDLSIVGLRSNDMTLPRTKDYICPNKNCDTNQKSKTIDKEAIFYRPIRNSYALKYMCTNCKTVWNP